MVFFQASTKDVHGQWQDDGMGHPQGFKKALFCYNQSIFQKTGTELSMKSVTFVILSLVLMTASLSFGAEQDIQEIFDRANESFKEGQYDKAINDYNTVIAKYPDLTEAYFNRGMTYYKKGKLDEAISDLSRVISARPKQIDALNSRGLAYLKKGDYEHAADDFTRVVAENPRLIETFYNRGIAYRGMGKNDQAIEDYNKVLSMRPNDSNAYTSRGIAYLAKATADFKTACDMGNKNACDNLKEISGKK